jgi:hypothetical protein
VARPSSDKFDGKVHFGDAMPAVVSGLLALHMLWRFPRKQAMAETG